MPSGYLSLLVRRPDLTKSELEEALYTRRDLVRVNCMRTTVHVVPAADLPCFLQAYAAQPAVEARDLERLLVQAGLCREREAGARLEEISRRVLAVFGARESCQAREVAQAVPELAARVRLNVGRPYEGEVSLGSRLIPALCSRGLLVRTRPQGTWRGSLYEYAALERWLPAIDVASVSPSEARARLVRRYLQAFAPVTPADVQWWTGLRAPEVAQALRALGRDVVEVTVEGLGAGYLMLAANLQELRRFRPLQGAYAFLLPGLDPYIMGYHDRRRFLDPAHQDKVFDRAGNALPTLWAGGRVVGAWQQRKDGTVACGLFAAASGRAAAQLEREARRVEAFYGGELVPPRTSTPFCRALAGGTGLLR